MVPMEGCRAENENDVIVGTNACNLDVSFLNIFNADGVRNLLGFQSEAKIFVRNQCCRRLLFIMVNTNVMLKKTNVLYNI